MEKNKRKRSEKERTERVIMEAKKKKVKRKEEEEAAVASEEEVEEFLAILRRMKTVVTYFNKGSGAGGEGWRAAAVEAEKTVMKADNDDVDVDTAKDVIDNNNNSINNNNRRQAMAESGVLDLNEAPEVEEEEAAAISI